MSAIFQASGFTSAGVSRGVIRRFLFFPFKHFLPLFFSLHAETVSRVAAKRLAFSARPFALRTCLKMLRSNAAPKEMIHA